MHLGILAPINSLSVLPIGNFHLVLSSWVLSNEKYAEFYAERSARGDWVILDNDAHEYKRASPINELVKAAQIVHPKEIVLPDAIRNAHQTVAATLAAYEQIREMFPFARLMAVVHGENQFEWQACALSHIAMGVDTIGIPRVYADDFGSWIPAVRFVDHYASRQTHIHLLGGPHRLTAAAEVERYFPGRVRSTDTSKPVHYAIAGLAFDDPITSDQRNPASRPPNFLDYSMTVEQQLLAIRNIQTLRRTVDHK